GDGPWIRLKTPKNWNAKSNARVGSLRPQRLKHFVDELKQNLRRRLTARRSKETIGARARELWEIEGRPPGRDLDFWLQAEREFREPRTTKPDRRSRRRFCLFGGRQEKQKSGPGEGA